MSEMRRVKDTVCGQRFWVYHDQYVKTDGQWMIANRQYHLARLSHGLERVVLTPEELS